MKLTTNAKHTAVSRRAWRWKFKCLGVCNYFFNTLIL